MARSIIGYVHPNRPGGRGQWREVERANNDAACDAPRPCVLAVRVLIGPAAGDPPVIRELNVDDHIAPSDGLLSVDLDSVISGRVLHDREGVPLRLNGG